MTKNAVLTLARVHGGKMEAGRIGMLVFSFDEPENALAFADSTGAMLIRGLERGAVFAAVKLT
jgi:hypothetical protein